jgi:hypothetical protein
MPSRGQGAYVFEFEVAFSLGGSNDLRGKAIDARRDLDAGPALRHFQFAGRETRVELLGG